ncbi:MAG: hypothetical protein JO135_06500 [Candidatus Eremiobacteraeota bacterium]|nr:hypothetical protein [Candidatus Eremiobacteraeota bacterium]
MKFRALIWAAWRARHDWGEAENVAQSMFLQLWEAPHALLRGNFEAWLTGVTRNRCTDIARTRTRRTALVESMHVGSPVAP